MRKLEFYVCNGEEKHDYRLIAELGKKEILKADRWGNIKDRIRLPKPMEFTRLLMLLWEAQMGYFGGWHRIDNNLKMIGTKVLHNEEVKQMEDKNTMDAFYEYLFESYEEECDYLYPNLYKEMMDDMTEEDAKFMEENEEECMSVVDENLDIHYPYDDFLDEEICCDIVIDNGDSNTDFNAHTISPCYEAAITKDRSNLSRESGMMLIAKLQDYRIKDFRKIFNACRYADTYGKTEKMKDLNRKYPFITSCYREIKESTGPLTAFVLCVKTTLREMLAWNTEKTDIRISKNIETCGLYDYWNGAGSNLEIHLEKDIVIPKEKVYRFVPDFYWDYSIKYCYGMTSNAWTTMQKIRETA